MPTSFPSPALKRRNPLKNAARLRKIVSVLATHGFHNYAERAKLGQYVFKRWSSGELESLSTPERLRMAFEKLGPTFVKFGQLLATRPDLIPEPFCREFSKLHDQVAALPFESIEHFLNEELGEGWKSRFSEFDKNPIAAASIAQVYEAKLKNGDAVVVKVQRPRVYETIREDLSVMYQIAEIAETYIPESRVFRPKTIVDEFFKTMELETDFVVEANNIRRFDENFKEDDQVKIPKVYNELSGKHVLVMEKIQGFPLTSKKALEQPGVDPEEILKTGLKAYLKMVFGDGLFHGDLHAGNMFVLPEGHLGLIDFGVVGRLNRKTQSAIANLILALSAEDYDRLAFEYLDLAPYKKDIDVDQFARDLRDLIAPHYGLTLKDVNVGKMLLDATALAARNGLMLPPELVMFSKSIVAIEGVGRLIKEDFDFLTYSLEFANDVIKMNTDSADVKTQMFQASRDLNSFIGQLPRQLRQMIRRVNSPDFAVEVRVQELRGVRRSFEKSGRLIFLGVIVASLIMSSSLIYVLHPVKDIWDMPWLSAVGFSLAVGLSLAAFVNYIRK